MKCEYIPGHEGQWRERPEHSVLVPVSSLNDPDNATSSANVALCSDCEKEVLE